MKNRVTLTLDPEVARRAKRLAHVRHTSVSGLVEDFLRSAPFAGGEKRSSFAASWGGRFELIEAQKPDLRREALLAKYGLKKR